MDYFRKLWSKHNGRAKALPHRVDTDTNSSNYAEVAAETPDEAPERFGLLVLNPEVKDVVVDIVALHGLGGDRLQTWTHENQACWIRDFLPKQIPGARVMTFGYNSEWGFSRSVAGINDFAEDLLDRLKGVRRHGKESVRPIIFICHSLGGIVCKRSLVLAHEQPVYENILKSTRGIVFMGTPHRGSTIADWTTMLVSIVDSMLVVGTSMRSDLLKNLQTNSDALQQITNSFISRTSGLQIVTFYEQEITTPLKSLVVNMDSAILNLPNERRIPVNANHREICKFSHANSQKYSPVWLAIWDIVSSISPDRSDIAELKTIDRDEENCLPMLAGVYPNGNPNIGGNSNGNPNAGAYPNGNPNARAYPNGNPNVGRNSNGNPNAGAYPNGNPNIGGNSNGNPNARAYPNGNPNVGRNSNGNPNAGAYPNGNPNAGAYLNGNPNVGAYLNGNPNVGRNSNGNPNAGLLNPNAGGNPLLAWNRNAGGNSNLARDPNPPVAQATSD
ncbi:hypothetical protein L873DRAFT_1754902 [Choiromyces venosus 120613-1]|uniref:DUF676 domain-containing protein n=1 Tax=Choiromyces venosus 120613-1 TaxID=1336337 RepID=A0A3N4IZD8_9PEZI|nr:hypothetical protein L873DRAFT_1754902 [Choiromyces venosus 120613-1]